MGTLDLGKALFSRLSGYSGLSALVESRIYPMEAPARATFPYVVYHVISDIPYHAMGSDPSIRSPRVQISALADTYANADAVGKQVRLAMQDYQGTITVGADSLVVQRCFWDGRIPDMSVDDPATMETVYQVSHDFIIWHD